MATKTGQRERETTLKTPTQRMIDRVETLKAGYAELIQADKGDGIDYQQWMRMNTLLGYLEERAAR